MRDSSSRKLRGVVREIGLEREEGRFHAFRVRLGVILKGEGAMDYEEGERLVRRLRRELLGKEVELETLIYRCPICGRGFNSEMGLKIHMRRSHGGGNLNSKPSTSSSKR